MLPWRNIKFGIELEGAPSDPVEVVARRCGSAGLLLPVALSDSERNVTTSWTFRCDGDGLEVSSPILDYHNWNDVRNLLHALKNCGVSTGPGSGLHVHLSVEGLTDSVKANLIRNWYCVEPALFRMVKSYRESSGWCHPIRDSFTVDNLFGLSDREVIRIATKRAFGPNGGWPTFECRAHHSTFSFVDIFSWVTLLQICVAKWSVTPVAKPDAITHLGLSLRTLFSQLETLVVENTSGAVQTHVLSNLQQRILSRS